MTIELHKVKKKIFVEYISSKCQVIPHSRLKLKGVDFYFIIPIIFSNYYIYALNKSNFVTRKYLLILFIPSF